LIFPKRNKRRKVTIRKEIIKITVKSTKTKIIEPKKIAKRMKNGNIIEISILHFKLINLFFPILILLNLMNTINTTKKRVQSKIIAHFIFSKKFIKL